MDKPKFWVKNAIKKKKHLGLSIFDPNLGLNNPALFRVWYNRDNPQAVLSLHVVH